MDDNFLYNHIKKAIKERKKLPKNSDEGTFAQRYCRRQLLKKKLTPNNMNSKMKSLLKKFSNVDTYVDLSQLLQSINLIRSKQISQTNISSPKQMSMSNLNNRKDSQMTQFNMDLIHSRIMAQLGDTFHKKYLKQNEQLDIIAQDIQQSSSVCSSGLMNNSGNQTAYLLGVLKKIEEQDKYQDNLSWNSTFFRNLTNNLKKNKDQSQVQYFKNTSLNSKDDKEHNKLLHKISTYLQIALQNEHKQKWATKELKNFRSTHGSFRFNKNKQTHFFTKNIKIQQDNSQLFKTQKKQSKYKHNLMRKINSQQRPNRQNKFSTFQTETKSIFNKQNNNLQKTQASSSFSGKQVKNKTKIIQNFTFRKRGIKKWVLNKLNSFIDDVDQQQINNKAQNKYYGDAINRLQRIIHASYGNFKQQALAGPQQITQLKRYVNGINPQMRKTTKCNGKYKM